MGNNRIENGQVPTDRKTQYHIGDMGSLITKAVYTQDGVLKIPSEVVRGEKNKDGSLKSHRGITQQDIPGLLTDAIISSGADALHITHWGLAKQQIGEEISVIGIDKLPQSGDIITLKPKADTSRDLAHAAD